MGQQVLNLGYSCEHGFVPLDSEIFISEQAFAKIATPRADKNLAIQRNKTMLTAISQV
jgi:hypothetical protein